MKAIKGENILERLSELRKSIREVRLWKPVEAIWLKESLGWSGKEVAMVLGLSNPNSLFTLAPLETRGNQDV